MAMKMSGFAPIDGPGSVVQPGARRHGIDGIHGNGGNMVSVSYRF